MNTETMERASRVAGSDRPTWRGQFRSLGGKWFTVRNTDGLPIAYATPQAAKNGAAFVGAAWRLNERATGSAPYTEASNAR